MHSIKKNNVILKAVDIKYNIANETILHNINLEIEKQECLVILGTTGSGKSILIKTLAGLLKPQTGNIIMLGEKIEDMNHEYRLKFMNFNIAFVFQEGGLINNLSVYENIVLPLKYYNRDQNLDNRVSEIINKFGLEKHKHKTPGMISLGMRKIVGLARAFLLESPILFLDEPTTNIDLSSIDKIIQMLRMFIILGGTVITVTSDMLFANSISSILGILDDGTIIEYGKPSKVKGSNKTLVQKVIRAVNKESDLADEILKLLTTR